MTTLRLIHGRSDEVAKERAIIASVLDLIEAEIRRTRYALTWTDGSVTLLDDIRIAAVEISRRGEEPVDSRWIGGENDAHSIRALRPLIEERSAPFTATKDASSDRIIAHLIPPAITGNDLLTALVGNPADPMGARPIDQLGKLVDALASVEVLLAIGCDDLIAAQRMVLAVRLLFIRLAAALKRSQEGREA